MARGSGSHGTEALVSSFLAWLGALLVVVLGALFAVPHFIDWNGYRGVFEEEASRVLGREVRVGGAVNVRLLPIPYLSFERLRVADTTSFSGEPLFRAESVTMRLAVPPLLRGILEANQVELKRPELRLAVDRNGTANWTALSIQPRALPFVPADVALRDVSIFDGRVTFDSTGGGEIARLDGIEGMVSGDALDGPYKFAGTVRWNGRAREVKLATARPDADGGVRFKSTVRAPASGNSYVLDGRIGDLKGRPSLAGELTAKLDLSALGISATDGAANHAAAEKPMLDVKARLNGDLVEATLSEIVMSFENVGQPQLLTGEATASWGEAPALTLMLQSRWLDIDRLAGVGKAAAPIATAVSVTEMVLAALPDEAKVTARLVVDQVSIGADAVSSLDVALARDARTLRLTHLSAGLPGGTHIDLSGTIEGREADARLHGLLMLGGSSLQRLLGWATRSPEISSSFPDGTFAFQGDLMLSQTTIEVAQASGEVAGTPLKGSLRAELGERRRVNIALEGNRIETAWLWPGGGQLTNLAALALLTSDAKAPTPTAAPAWLDSERTDLTLQLMAGHLVDGERVLRDVRADIALARGSVTISGLRFSTSDGLAVDLEGGIRRDALRPEGALRGVVSAPSPEALATFHALTGLSSALPRAAEIAASLAPLDVALTLDLAKPGKGAFNLVLDGTSGGGRLLSQITLDRLGADWRAAPATASLALTDANVKAMLARAFGPPRTGQPAANASVGGTLRLDVAGVPSSGMLTTASAALDDLSLTFEGRTQLAETGWLEANGDLDIRSGSASQLMAWTGLDIPDVGAKIAGRLEIARRGGELTLSPADLELAGSKLSGEIRIARADAADGPLRLDADLSVNAARIPSLLSIILDPPRPEHDSGLEDSIEASVWTERPFRSPLLAHTEGRVKARFGTLQLDSGLSIEAALVEAALEPNRITISRLEGGAMGGKLSGSLVIEKVAAGAEASGRLALEDGRLDALGARPAADRRVQGPISVTLGFSGRALGPRGVVAALKGKGVAKLGAATIDGLAPVSVARATEAVLVGRAQPGSVGLIEAIKAELGQGRLPLGPSEVPIEIVDGALRFAAAAIDTKEGRTTVETTIDLASLKVDSEWVIEAKGRSGTRARDQLWPGVKVLFVGPLGRLSDIEPQISVAALERELTVRRMEIEVDELERLRRLDEERIRQERTRQKALEDERARAAIRNQNAVPPNGIPPPTLQQKPGASIEWTPLPPPNNGPGSNATTAPVAPPATAAAPTEPATASPAPAPRPAVPRPQVRRAPSPAETTLQGLLPPGTQ